MEMIEVIILTNSGSQELAPGQSLTFDTVVLHTGRCECYRPGSGAVIVRGACGAIFDDDFSANIGATAPGVAQIALAVGGSQMRETTMVSTTAAAGDVNRVSADTSIRTCGGNETLTVTNTGTTTIVVENPLWRVRRVA